MVVISMFTEAEVAFAYRIFKTDRVNAWAYNTFEKSALNTISLVAKENKNTLGYVLLSSVLDELTIEDIAVDATVRKKGIGRKLMDAVFAIAIQMQQKVIYLEVRFSNMPAIELYRSMGFELIGERKNYYESAVEAIDDKHTDKKNNSVAPRENAYIMKKVL